MNTSRRDFFKLSAQGAAAVTLAGGLNVCARPESEGRLPFELGMASYTFREFSLDETIKMTKQLALRKIALKSFHMPLNASLEKIQKDAQKVRDAGLDLYGGGVIYMKSKEEVERAFEYCKAAGMRVMIGVPNHDLLDLVNEKVQAYDIKLAIHNHGPGDDVYPSPESAYEKVKHLDPRMGLCIDIGHTKRIGLDPSDCAREFADRLHDIHIKDVSAATAKGTTIEIGRGVIDIPGFLKTLIEIKYSGAVSFEFEKDGKNPMPGTAESVGYVRGVLDVIA